MMSRRMTLENRGLSWTDQGRKMKNFNLKQLEAFTAVAQTRSFTKAASLLFLSQSTISSHVMALETELGVVLFNRETRRGITLTPDAARLLPIAQDILQRCQAIEDNISPYSPQELVIGASTVPAQHLVPDLLASFRREDPSLSFFIHTGDSEEIIRMVLENEVQIGFVGANGNRPALNCRPIWEDHLVVVTPNDEKHQAARDQGLLGKALLTEPLILRERGSGTQALVDFFLSRTDHAGLMTVSARASDPNCIKELVARGVGISILSGLSVREEVQTGKLLQFELDEPPVLRKFHMITRKNARLSQRVEELAAWVTRTL